MIKDYIIRIGFELTRAGLPKDVINEVYELLTHDRLINNKKSEQDKFNQEFVDRCMLLHGDNLVLQDADKIKQNAEIVERIEREEESTGRALVDVQNWLSEEGKFTTQVINDFCREILGKE